MAGTYRSFRPEVQARIRAAVQRVAENVAAAFRACVDVKFGGEEIYPALYNDPAMTNFVRETVAEALGPDKLVELEHPIMAAEDFAYYLQQVPGAFVFLGNNSDPATTAPPLHSSRFDFRDEAIPAGVKLLSSLALRFLQ
jgi:metal-dependent amidase/aminoacylase/carboxypeptidase family protein